MRVIWLILQPFEWNVVVVINNRENGLVFVVVSFLFWKRFFFGGKVSFSQKKNMLSFYQIKRPRKYLRIFSFPSEWNANSYVSCAHHSLYCVVINTMHYLVHRIQTLSTHTEYSVYLQSKNIRMHLLHWFHPRDFKYGYVFEMPHYIPSFDH